MRKNFKNIGLILVFISSLVYVSCHKDEIFSDEAQLAGRNGSRNIVCNGKRVLKFNTLADLQQAHLQLYQQYETSNQDEQVLVDYETTHSFYSLRKKADDMAEGIIPDDPAFDETNFTLDPVLETLLNQDGMIIIGDRLYVWDSGCLIQSIPFSCSNYEKLLAFYNAAQTNATDVMHSIFVGNEMQHINTCDDVNYDFETISENGGRVQEGEAKAKNKNGCGYEAIANSALISCSEEWNTYKISPEYIKPLDAGDPLNFFYITSGFGDLDALEFSLDGAAGSFQPYSLTFQDQNYGYLLPFVNEFYMRIPAGETEIFTIKLRSSIALLQGNSCSSFDSIDIDNSCPYSITATAGPVSQSQISWTFTIHDSLECSIGNGKVIWNFGDGTIVTGGKSITHVYNIPCMMQYLTVTATIEGVVCGVTGKVLTKENIPFGDPCMRENYKFPTYKDNVDGKKLKLTAIIKTNIFDKTVLKNVYKHRVAGDKEIKSIGSIYKPTANNSSCSQIDITTVIGTKVKSGKSRNPQRKAFGAPYHINAMNPYKVIFTHSGGFSHALTADDLYCSQ